MDYLCFDINNIIWKSLAFSNPNSSGNKGKGKIDVHALWKYNFLANIFRIIIKVSPNKGVVFAQDIGESWRHSIYDKYKGKRNKSKSFPFVDDFPAFFSMSEGFITDLCKSMPQVMHLSYPTIEADDFIALFVMGTTDDTMVISADKDFYQLKKYKHYHQSTDGVGDILVPKPKRYLFEKICLGDTSDNIPSIIFRMGKKKFDDMMADGSLMNLLDTDPEVAERFIKNRQLIDFTHIREDVKQRVNQIIGDWVPTKNNEYEFYSFLVKHRMSFIESEYMNPINRKFTNMWKNLPTKVDNKLF